MSEYIFAGRFSYTYRMDFPENAAADWDYMHAKISECPACSKTHKIGIEDLHDKSPRFFICGAANILVELHAVAASSGDGPPEELQLVSKAPADGET